MSQQPEQIILRPIEPNYQYQVPPIPQYQPYPIQPQYIVVSQPPKQDKPEKQEKPKQQSQFKPGYFWTGAGIIGLVFAVTFHQARLADVKAEALKQGYQQGLESAQSQIQQANAEKAAAIAESESYKATLNKINQIVTEQQKPLFQLGVINH